MKILQPLVHGIPRNGNGNYQGNHYQLQEIFRQQSYNIQYRCAEGFADADLFHALLRRISSKP
jgi:hypothetical protein